MEIKIRKMLKSDIAYFPHEFALQGWNKPIEQYERYYAEQESGARRVFVATVNDCAAGYATLFMNASEGPYKNQNIPEVVDFNVLIKYQRHGVGTAVLDAIEEYVKTFSAEICLGIGLHSGYGSAQRMYVKRGYIPDGSGVWYNDSPLPQYAPAFNDDGLILYLKKRLK